MSKKIYAVKAGRKTGIFDTWEECSKQVSGFSGAVYKSFQTEKEAKEYLDGPSTTVRLNKESSKIYAVRKGRKTGIFYSWGECSDYTKGYPGAEYKSFYSEEEAKEYLGLPLVVKEKKTITKEPPKMKEFKEKPVNKTDELIPEKIAEAYVDGSFNEETNKYGSGVVFMFNGKTEEMYESGNNKDLVIMRNVAGEIIGAVLAVKAAVKAGASKIIIYHDYTGIANWANGNWAAKKPGTQMYKNFMQEAMEKIKIEFKKVTAHTGVEYNERADILAKTAVGIIQEKQIFELELSEEQIELSEKYPEIINNIKSFIKENNFLEEFDVIDIFFEKHEGNFDESDTNKIEELITTIYNNEVQNGEIGII